MTHRNITHFIAFSILSAALVLFSGCGEKDEPAPVTDKTPRAVLVYMVADNSLGSISCDTADLDEMATAAEAGDLGKSRLFVYHAGRHEAPTLLEITSDGTETLVEYDYSESSVSSARMSQVIEDFKKASDASAYGLVLWSHGSGWIQNGMEKPDVKSKSWGDDRGRYMNITTLAQTLDGKGFDYVYFDCCYMAGVEIAYELRDVTDMIVASATELPIDGMPYDRTLRHLMPAEPDLAGAAAATFSHYDGLTGDERTCTISVIDTSAIDELASATAAIYTSSSGTAEGFTPQPFMTGSCYLYDFGQYVTALSADRSKTERFNSAIGKAIVYKASTPRLWDIIDLKHHSGLSTFILSSPDKATYRNYDQLSWYRDVARLIFD